MFIFLEMVCTSYKLQDDFYYLQSLLWVFLENFSTVVYIFLIELQNFSSYIMKKYSYSQKVGLRKLKKEVESSLSCTEACELLH